jgi:GntR family transcriptional regulator
MTDDEARAPVRYLNVRPAIDSRERVEALIRDRGLRPGDQLPTERELAHDWGVSRSAVRSAIRTLVSEYRIVQRQGSGTYVAAGPMIRNLRDLKSFVEVTSENGRAATTTVLGCVQEQADMRTADSLGIDPGESVWYLRRLRNLDQVPALLEESRLPVARFPGLDKRVGYAESLYAMLGEVYGAGVESGHEVLAVGFAEPEVAQLLDVGPGHPVFELSGVAYDGAGAAVEVFRSWVRSEQVSFASELRVPSTMSDGREGAQGG